MHEIERTIHGLLEGTPRLKSLAVGVYQAALGIVPVSQTWPDDAVLLPGFFFGFHDKSPWSASGKYLAVHRVPRALPLHCWGTEPLPIGVIQDGDPASFTPLGMTRLWNWQQGAELQWRGLDHEVIFNDLVERRPGSRLLDLSGRALAEWPYPLAALDSRGARAISYCFACLAQGMRGYGYHLRNGHHPDCRELLLLDLETDSSTVIATTTRLSAASTRSDRSHHFFSHATFSPLGTSVAFYLRGVDEGGRQRTSLYRIDLDSGATTRLTLGDCSHYCWLGEREILAYAKPETAGWGYYRIKTVPGALPVADELLPSFDGHPQLSPDERHVLIGSYPDRFRL